jgi:hypothetical protein
MKEAYIIAERQVAATFASSYTNSRCFGWTTRREDDRYSRTYITIFIIIRPRRQND